MTIPERFTVEHADRLLRALQPAAAAGQSVRLDLSRVAAIDTAALQLLVAARRQLGDRCQLEGVAEPVRERARLLGVARLLGLA